VFPARNPLQSSVDDDGFDKDALTAGGDDDAFLTLDDMAGGSHSTQPKQAPLILQAFSTSLSFL